MRTFLNRRPLAVPFTSNFLQTVLALLIFLLPTQHANQRANLPLHANQRANPLLTTQIHSRINFNLTLTSIPTSIDLTMAILDDDAATNTPPRDEDTTAFHDTLERRLASTSNSTTNSISSELLPTDLDDATTPTITIGGVAFELEPTEQATTESTALYTKAMRATYAVSYTHLTLPTN